MLHPCDTWYTDRQHPIYQRLSFSHNGGIFARFSVRGQTGEVESLIALGCFFVSLETAHCYQAKSLYLSQGTIFGTFLVTKEAYFIVLGLICFLNLMGMRYRWIFS
jgi:hypothetical protein